MRAPFVVVFALSAAVSGASERALTLEEALTLALENFEGIQIERESLAAAEAAGRGAEGAYDPVIDVSGGFQRATPPVNSPFSGASEGDAAPTVESTDASASVRKLLKSGGEISVSTSASRSTTDGIFTLLSPAYFTQAGIALRQPLLRDRVVDAARTRIRIAASDRSRASAELRREVLETVSRVEATFWTLTAARAEIAVREEAVRLAEEQLSETVIRIERGAAPETEISQPRAELERRRGELIASREALSRAENALKILILGEGDATLWAEGLVPEEPLSEEATPIDVAASIERALGSRPELLAAEAAIERRRAERAFAQDGIRPILDVVVSYDRLGLAGSRNPAGTTIPGLPTEIPRGLDGGLGRSYATLGEESFDDVRAGFVLQIPIGNREARAAEAVAASAERQAELQLARLRNAVRAEVLDAAAALETAGQRVESSRAAREAAEVQLSSEQERYVVGLSTNFLVLTRQNDLSRARLDEIAAQTDYRKARTEMARATGSLLEERGIDVESATT